MKSKSRKRTDKKVLSFFMLAFPTLIIVALSILIENTSWAQILIAIYQFILIKQFLDNYYEVL